MFQILKQKQGTGGSFIRLIKLGVDDYTVLLRSSDDGRLRHRYVGPDFSKAEEVFNSESERISRLVDL